MAEVTTLLPTVGLDTVFSFKEPFSKYIQNKFNLESELIPLRVISVIALRDTIRVDMRDPFTDIYDVVGLDEVDYKMDLEAEVPVITFAFMDPTGVERFFRIPHSYISEIGDANSVTYSNRALIIDLGLLPEELDLSPVYRNIKDYVLSLTGVEPELMDTTVGDTSLLGVDEHNNREAIRLNNVTVFKPLTVQLAECQESRDNILNRLDELGISLAD